MSRNLCTSSCPKCGYQVKLSDMRGKPVEFRRYGPYAPEIGVRFDCQCGEVYFLMWHHRHEFWSDPSKAFDDELVYGRTVIPNTDKGKFVSVTEFRGEKRYSNTGFFDLDLSYYESFNDEKIWTDNGNDFVAVDAVKRILAGTLEPGDLCTDDAADTQRIL